MPQIAPMATIYLLKGCPIDKGKNHTLYFANEQAQHTYFQSLPKFSFTEYQYIKAEQGLLRIQSRADALLECNYIMFNNGNSQSILYKDKWFYGYIDFVEYDSELVTKVHYTIDPLQTWLFDFELGMSFVEREHSATDNIGDNVIDEGLELGEYQGINNTHIDSSEMHAAVLSTETPQGATGVRRGPFNGIYSGLYVKSGFGIDSIQFNGRWNTQAVTWFSGYDNTIWHENTISTTKHELVSIPSGTAYKITAEKTSDLLRPYHITCTNGGEKYDMNISNEPKAMFINKRDIGTYDTTAVGLGKTVTITLSNMPQSMSPTFGELTTYIESFTNPSAIVAIYQYPAWLDSNDVTERITEIDRPTALTNGYVPKNNKLFTYPYSFLSLSNNQGSNMEYRWENTENGETLQLVEQGTLYGYPTILIYPRNYRHIYNDYEYGLMLSNFPTCSWDSDVFKQWWNENKSSFITSTVAGAVENTTRFAVASATGNAVTAGLQAESLLTGISTSLAKYTDMKAIPAQAKGQIQADGLNAAIGRLGFTAYTVSLRQEYLKIIDDYFTEFGYACHQVKVPNIHARTKWTYTKTRGCVIHAASDTGLPADAENEIAKIFDNGITFWVNGNEVGDYSLSNDIITGGDT